MLDDLLRPSWCCQVFSSIFFFFFRHCRVGDNYTLKVSLNLEWLIKNFSVFSFFWLCYIIIFKYEFNCNWQNSSFGWHSFATALSEVCFCCMLQGTSKFVMTPRTRSDGWHNRSNYLRISNIGLEFGGVMHSTMEQIPIWNSHKWPILHVSQTVFCLTTRPAVWDRWSHTSNG